MNESFTAVIGVEATAEVTHNAPCVPECSICYPQMEGND